MAPNRLCRSRLTDLPHPTGLQDTQAFSYMSARFFVVDKLQGCCHEEKVKHR